MCLKNAIQSILGIKFNFRNYSSFLDNERAHLLRSGSKMLSSIDMPDMCSITVGFDSNEEFRSL